MGIEPIQLPGTSIVTTALGLGTTALLGLQTEKDRLSILERAFELGIRHYDTAPYYGYGAAEETLGRFIHNRRDRVTVTTKFGIQPLRVVSLSRTAELAKRITRRLPLARRILSHQAAKLVQRNTFSVPEAEKSLEASLRALKTDYIDIYLLHEATAAKTASDELLSFLNRQQQQGSIRAFGTGSEFGRLCGVVEQNPDYARVAQFENNLLRCNLERFLFREQCAVITHGVLGSAYKELVGCLQSNPAMIANCSARMGADCGDKTVVAALLLTYAVRANPRGVVLFSTARADHLQQNVSAMIDQRFSQEQVNMFRDLVNARTRDSSQDCLQGGR